jgi:hypothetical protein
MAGQERPKVIGNSVAVFRMRLRDEHERLHARRPRILIRLAVIDRLKQQAEITIERARQNAVAGLGEGIAKQMVEDVHRTAQKLYERAMRGRLLPFSDKVEHRDQRHHVGIVHLADLLGAKAADQVDKDRRHDVAIRARSSDGGFWKHVIAREVSQDLVWGHGAAFHPSDPAAVNHGARTELCRVFRNQFSLDRDDVNPSTRSAVWLQRSPVAACP